MRLKKICPLFFCIFSSLISLSQVNKDNSILFITDLSNNRFQEAYDLLDSTTKQAITLKVMEETWKGLQNQVGGYQSYSTIKTESKNNLEIIIVACQFQKSNLDFKLVFNEENKIMGFFFIPPQPTVSYQKASYDNESYYVESKIVVKSGKFSLPGILTMPKKKGNVPIVVLIHGSGPSDKDESLGPNKIFKDIASGLAANGIASIRYDKRTKVYASTLNPDSVTLKEEIIDDVNSAINMASSLQGVNPSEIYLLGHSLGGMVAPKIASENSKVKGIILFAANARPLQDLLLEQTRYVISADGLNDNEKLQLDALDKQVKLSKQSTLSTKTSRSELPMNIPAFYWIYLNNYKQVETAIKLHQRILVLQGERDYQVTQDDFTIWKKNLGANKNATLKSYPKLNHLFIAGENKSEPKDYETSGNVDYQVIQDISEWINKK
ncbi:MAG TPA: alpha/beta fold hydrolase [Bacteroidia bacterium]|jgi:hypothetical protein|nr:alpha/beta fold hydrolase [Bacteroidia bacterium]